LQYAISGAWSDPNGREGSPLAQLNNPARSKIFMPGPTAKLKGWQFRSGAVFHKQACADTFVKLGAMAD
jgi:hypothetical protein